MSIYKKENVKQIKAQLYIFKNHDVFNLIANLAMFVIGFFLNICVFLDGYELIISSTKNRDFKIYTWSVIFILIYFFVQCLFYKFHIRYYLFPVLIGFVLSLRIYTIYNPLLDTFIIDYKTMLDTFYEYNPTYYTMDKYLILFFIIVVVYLIYLLVYYKKQYKEYIFENNSIALFSYRFSGEKHYNILADCDSYEYKIISYVKKGDICIKVKKNNCELILDEEQNGIYSMNLQEGNYDLIFQFNDFSGSVFLDKKM